MIDEPVKMMIDTVNPGKYKPESHHQKVDTGKKKVVRWADEYKPESHHQKVDAAVPRKQKVDVGEPVIDEPVTMMIDTVNPGKYKPESHHQKVDTGKKKSVRWASHHQKVDAANPRKQNTAKQNIDKVTELLKKRRRPALNNLNKIMSRLTQQEP